MDSGQWTVDVETTSLQEDETRLSYKYASMPLSPHTFDGLIIVIISSPKI